MPGTARRTDKISAAQRPQRINTLCVDYEYVDEDRANAIAWLGKIAAIVEPKLKKR
jgi:hypothetical protein